MVGADGRAYERRARQTLCRCGQSGNKPFCDGSHWYAGFRDPLPRELVKPEPTVYEWIGGIEALERLTTRFYEAIHSEPDPLLEPVFRGMDPNHPKHVAAWLAETFGGPQLYTDHHGGYEHMLAKHRDRELTEEQRQRWVTRMVATADEIGLPADPDFRSTFVAYLEWGTRIAVVNSHTGAAVIEHAPVPHWGWGQTPPFSPQPWDDPGAAERGRRRYAEEQARTRADKTPPPAAAWFLAPPSPTTKRRNRRLRREVSVMSDESLRTAGILLVVYPTVVFGGASLLWHWITRRSAFYDHPAAAKHVAGRARPCRRAPVAVAGRHRARRSRRARRRVEAGRADHHSRRRPAAAHRLLPVDRPT